MNNNFSNFSSEDMLEINGGGALSSIAAGVGAYGAVVGGANILIGNGISKL